MSRAILLGNAQDAGLPQAGCRCVACSAAWADPGLRRYACALGLVDDEAGEFFLIDATPDLREQLHMLQVAAPGARLAGVLLTHAHIGHYTGLIHVGLEAMDTRSLPLYVTPRMAAFLRSHAPWSQLVTMENVAIHELAIGAWHMLTPDLAIQPLAVPHRDEWSDTVAFVVRGPERRLLYLPDINRWEQWELPVREVVAGVHIALLDGTFFSPEELPGRDLTRIAHPFVTDTAARLTGLDCAIRLIHLNHSNPLHQPSDERRWLVERGLGVGEQGDEWRL